MPKAKVSMVEEQPTTPTVSRPEPVKKELPDFRKYLNIYEFDVVLPSGITVKLKPINAGQLKKFMTSVKNDTLKELSDAMYELISSSVVNEDFDINNVYLNDRASLILELRKISKGTKYQFEYKCPKCSSQSFLTEDLNDIEVIPIPSKINPIVTLDENLSVIMDYVKIGDEKEILEMGMKSEPELLLSVIAVSVKGIITPEGEQTDLSLEDKIYFTDNIPQPFYEKLTNWHDEFHFGVNMKRKIKCVHCKEESDFTLEADNFFF